MGKCVLPLIQTHAQGYIIFADTVLDKRASQEIELSRKQYSGNEHRVVKGIGLVNCVYVNPVSDHFWVIDYRRDDPDGDGKSKLDHVLEMLPYLIYYKSLPFRTVLMDTWYATKNLRQYIDKEGKLYYCPLKKNRLVDDTGGKDSYKSVASVEWNESQQKMGKIITH